ncbi:SCO family protein [Thiomicrorhabdus xiamenensis]|uniref:SCO family protein n=1 Tax=Thiomicrorhabdus xiamenensis TaxID=2739063 RepID=A0A7D4TEJ0_9GAMM|nr:SCO family protein [Thiomicrorhabdus xiamenensis]QKI89467.1 SCO family protein [Thiomicrorhabdus xiamenensis]
MSNKLTLAIILIGALLGFVLLSTPMQESNTHSQAHLILDDKPQGGDFTLTAYDGQHALSELKNKLVLVYFGYTFCPDICPTNLGNLSVAYRNLTQEQKDQLQILFVSVDPERDTPERLQQYANYFEANILGLTGSPETLSEIAKRYGVVYHKVDDPNNGTNYAVDHSAFTYVIDQNGALQEQLPHATSPDQFVATIEKYLN